MQTSTSSDTTEAIRARARFEGFDGVGITGPDAIPHARAGLEAYVEAGHHGTMDWLARDPGRRADPCVLWPEARSAVVVTQNYAPDHDPLTDLVRHDRGTISVYARGRDYHDVLKGRLKRLGHWTGDRYGCGVKVFVDTAPLMEKPLAAAAGLGWQGKHTNLVSREHGSWLFLGVMLTTLDLDRDAAESDHCGSCRACLDICPTDAFPAPYRIDARRCISYLTIEHKGHIAPDFREAMGNRIYGCDDCLAVCPWNKFAQAGREAKLKARDDLNSPALADLVQLDDAAFRARFSGSPIKRTGRDRFVRNVLIAIGNSGDRALSGPARERLDDASPLVRAMAVWALSRLLPSRQMAELARDRLSVEPDEAVRSEWHAALAPLPEDIPA